MKKCCLVYLLFLSCLLTKGKDSRDKVSASAIPAYLIDKYNIEVKSTQKKQKWDVAIGHSDLVCSAFYEIDKEIKDAKTIDKNRAKEVSELYEKLQDEYIDSDKLTLADFFKKDGNLKKVSNIEDSTFRYREFLKLFAKRLQFLSTVCIESQQVKNSKKLKNLLKDLRCIEMIDEFFSDLDIFKIKDAKTIDKNRVEKAIALIGELDIIFVKENENDLFDYFKNLNLGSRAPYKNNLKKYKEFLTIVSRKLALISATKISKSKQTSSRKTSKEFLVCNLVDHLLGFIEFGDKFVLKSENIITLNNFVHSGIEDKDIDYTKATSLEELLVYKHKLDLIKKEKESKAKMDEDIVKNMASVLISSKLNSSKPDFTVYEYRDIGKNRSIKIPRLIGECKYRFEDKIKNVEVQIKAELLMEAMVCYGSYRGYGISFPPHLTIFAFAPSVEECHFYRITFSREYLDEALAYSSGDKNSQGLIPREVKISNQELPKIIKFKPVSKFGEIEGLKQSYVVLSYIKKEIEEHSKEELKAS